MKRHNTKLRAFVLHEIEGLEPITVILQDLGVGKGVLLIHCYNRAWTARWNTMGGKISEFLRDAPPDVIANDLLRTTPTLHGEHDYLTKICTAIQESLSTDVKRYVPPGSRPTPTQDKILELLETQGHKTFEQMAVRLCVDVNTVRIACDALHEGGFIHIAEYTKKKRAGPWSRVWGAGREEDAKPPRPKTAAKRCKEYRERKAWREAENAAQG